jgi:hypothetical protein
MEGEIKTVPETEKFKDSDMIKGPVMPHLLITGNSSLSADSHIDAILTTDRGTAIRALCNTQVSTQVLRIASFIKRDTCFFRKPFSLLGSLDTVRLLALGFFHFLFCLFLCCFALGATRLVLGTGTGTSLSLSLCGLLLLDSFRLLFLGCGLLLFRSSRLLLLGRRFLLFGCRGLLALCG